MTFLTFFNPKKQIDTRTWGVKEKDILRKSNVPFILIGHVSKGEIRIDDRSFGDVSEYKEIYNTALAAKLKQ